MTARVRAGRSRSNCRADRRSPYTAGVRIVLEIEFEDSGDTGVKRCTRDDHEGDWGCEKLQESSFGAYLFLGLHHFDRQLIERPMK